MMNNETRNERKTKEVEKKEEFEMFKNAHLELERSSLEHKEKMKMNEIVVKENDTDVMIADINNTTKMVKALMASPHYKQMGAEGIFAIVEKAKSIGIAPLDALNGGMYFVQGKVEMSASMMNQLIRVNKHSVTKDKNSNETICILHGKRSDNNDTWSESFSIKDAKLAGIYRNQWLKYPKDMLFARALSRLARQLFPDVIKGCYVEDEISDAPPLNAPVANAPVAYEEEVKEAVECITEEQHEELEEALGDNDVLRENILTFINRKWGADCLAEMPTEIFDHAMKRANESKEEDNG